MDIGLLGECSWTSIKSGGFKFHQSSALHVGWRDEIDLYSSQAFVSTEASGNRDMRLCGAMDSALDF